MQCHFLAVVFESQCVSCLISIPVLLVTTKVDTEMTPPSAKVLVGLQSAESSSQLKQTHSMSEEKKKMFVVLSCRGLGVIS